MLSAGSGWTFEMEIVVPGQNLRERESITSSVDVAILPKAIGGVTVAVDEETGEEDEMCCRGVKFPRLSAFLRGLEGRA